MKQFIAISIILLLSMILKGQTGTTFVCSYYGEAVSQEILDGKLQQEFISNEEAIKAVDKIIEPTGLKRNFIVLEDSRVGNASALIYKEKRYVFTIKALWKW